VDEDREGQRGFTVKDRRRFSETGDVREPDAAQAPEPEAPAAEAKPAGPTPAPPEHAAAGPGGPAEPVTFSTFVLGLSTQALLHLGEIPNPVTRTVETDLDAARQVIDILGMLADKTRNNLEPGEQSLLESALYDLRMRYVELRRAGAKEKR
jgi:uncharacterized protein DUF1844